MFGFIRNLYRSRTGRCIFHGCDLSWRDDGDPESGPHEPYQYCPQCDLEDQPKCPKCGVRDGFQIRSIPTRNYGGGWDTIETCESCGYREVFV